MGLSLLAYLVLGITGLWMRYSRKTRQAQPEWLRTVHFELGLIMVFLVLLLLAIGVIGTMGEYGTLGHSLHLPAGLIVVFLVGFSAWSATQIHPDRPWARPLHLGTNLLLFGSYLAVSLTGWSVVQKYLP